MKTPEEMAEECADSGLYRLKRYVDGRVKPSQGALGLQNRACKYGFLAGYQAAKDQFADSSKVMPQWISVKDRLPEIGERGYSDDVLMLSEHVMEVTHIEKVKRIVKWKGLEEVIETNNGTPIEEFTHWMPLPKPPEE